MENQSENLTETKAKANRKMSNRADSHRCSPNKGTRVTSLDRGCFASCVCFDPIRVVSGGVFCHLDYPVPVSSFLELKILVLDIAVPMLPGLQVLVAIQFLEGKPYTMR
ncbi:uncharacterized protein [Lolium perenne]|uniref:uncharacterized protein n=1 Tax=Lolium perenne TaxID=4522 RepID=UPI0021F57979|nr:uncharacterized protein LOC127345606 [Lolium perenne]